MQDSHIITIDNRQKFVFSFLLAPWTLTLNDLEGHSDSVIFYTMFREKLAYAISIEIMILTFEIMVTPQDGANKV